MNKNFPVKIIIFGGTGDLVKKKIIPALFNLYINNLLSNDFEIIGVSRKQMTDIDYRNFVKTFLSNESDLDGFLSKVRYFSADVSDEYSFNGFVDFMNSIDAEKGICANKMFYLALSPVLYDDLFIKLKNSGLMNMCVDGYGESSWSRILVEKPFGNDMVHAEKLDKMLGQLFSENQIFRIDHYLAKETLQNILTFRFANSIFEPIWNTNSIEKIEINMFENLEVSERGSLYDGVGALRDVGQNHVLQMLALIAMEDPEKLDVDLIRERRAALLESLELVEDFVAPRAQYLGYKDIIGVSPDSNTETFFKIKSKIKNSRWSGVDFYLSSGKALKETKTEIIITFKEKPTSICPKEDDKDYKNIIKFRIQPKEGISILFWSKKPGFNYSVEEKELEFNYTKEKERIPDAYERVLFDCIRGDQTLFVSTREVLAQWKFIDEVIEKWQKTPLVQYEKGIDPEQIKFNI